MSRFVAAIYDRFMRRSEEACLRAWRQELLSDLSGDVVELGAGTGANLPFYPPSVRSLLLTEPDPYMRARLTPLVDATRAQRSQLRLALAPAPATQLPLPDASVDAVVSTLVLCTVPDPEALLVEVRRVLRPWGRFLFLEHVAAEGHPGRLRWQQRLEPLWKRLAGGCHLTRRSALLIEAAGLPIEQLQHESMRRALPWIRPTVRGVARRPAAG
jgi:ubiquinone/menaquinone biosynthesis C-methylase UbiE